MSTSRPSTWMPLYWGDYLKDTGHLSAAQHGAYLLLLGHHWVSARPLPDENGKLARIARMTPQEWRFARPTISAFFTVADGKWTSKRVIAELEKWTSIQANARAAGIASSLAKLQRKQQDDANTRSFPVAIPLTVPLPPGSHPSPSPSIPYGETVLADRVGVAQESAPQAASPPPNPVSNPIEKPNLVNAVNTAVAEWNSLAERLGLPAVQRMTRARVGALNARLRECGGLEGWKNALAKVETSAFLSGRAPPGNGHENWRVDFDFVCKSSHFTKLMEGGYDDRPSSGPGSAPTRPSRDGFATLAAALKRTPDSGDFR